MKCENCRKEFVPNPSRKQQKFCSRLCTNRNACKRFYRRRKEWFIKRALAQQKKDPEHWKKINNKATRRYKDKTRFSGKRKLVLTKYENVCARCKKKRLLHIHHADGKSYHNGRPNNKLKNLIPFCCSCHHILHHAMRRKEITAEDIVCSYGKP